MNQLDKVNADWKGVNAEEIYALGRVMWKNMIKVSDTRIYTKNEKGKREKERGKLPRNDAENARTWKQADFALMLDKCQRKKERKLGGVICKQSLTVL